MLWRAIFAFLALPGIVAFAVPLMLARDHFKPLRAWTIGLLPLVGGSFLLLYCVREFYVAGRGTLAPWAPPQHLVTSGPYRYSRNPMYVGVATILIGWSIFFHSMLLAIYALCVVIGFVARVLFFEEPWANRNFGDQWQQYRARVARWFYF
ncbi:MAG TPA: isoprenylcysteine carboxylmethyltransferase family protein [Steroidobacteraceae bacterium]